MTSSQDTKTTERQETEAHEDEKVTGTLEEPHHQGTGAQRQDALHQEKHAAEIETTKMKAEEKDPGVETETQRGEEQGPQKQVEVGEDKEQANPPPNK